MPTKIVCENGDYQEILSRFESQAETLIPEYINTLYNPDDIYKSHTCFNGLLYYLYRNMFMPDSPDETPNNYIKRSVLYPHDLKMLDIVYSFYMGLCARFSKYPSLLGMSMLTGINLVAMMKDETRNAQTRAQLKAYNAAFETYLQDRVVSDNSIGAMFMLKAKYGYNDTPTQRVEISTAAVPVIDKSDILAITSDDTET